MFGGRWNPRGSFPTVYLAEPVDTCVAEFLRMARGQARGAESFRPRQLHVVRATELELVDLTTEAALGLVGLSESNIADDDWASWQRVGEVIHFLGYQGLRAPSATGLGTVFGIFETRLRHQQLKVVETRPIGPLV